MNDLSPPDASAAPAPAAPPPPAEPDSAGVTAETAAGFCRNPLRSRPQPVEPPPRRSLPALESRARRRRPTAPPAAAPPASRSARIAFALPLVSEDDPCGPDLDLEGDTEFMNFIAATEGLLPASYYAFNRASIDFSAALQTAEKLLKRTLDLRLLVLMAKLSILNRDIAGFAQRIGNIAWLVKRALGGRQSEGRGRRLFGAHRATGDARGQRGRPPAAAIRAAHRNQPRGRALLSRPAPGVGRGPAALCHAL